MKIVLVLEPGGVRLDKLFSKSLRTECEVARLFASLEPEIGALDRAVRVRWKEASKGRRRLAAASQDALQQVGVQ